MANSMLNPDGGCWNNVAWVLQALVALGARPAGPSGHPGPTKKEVMLSANPRRRGGAGPVGLWCMAYLQQDRPLPIANGTQVAVFYTTTQEESYGDQG